MRIHEETVTAERQGNFILIKAIFGIDTQKRLSQLHTLTSNLLKEGEKLYL